MELGMLTSIAITASPSFVGSVSCLASSAQNLSAVVKAAADALNARSDRRDRKQASPEPAGGKP